MLATLETTPNAPARDQTPERPLETFDAHYGRAETGGHQGKLKTIFPELEQAVETASLTNFDFFC